MKGLNNELYVTLLIISNLIAVFQLVASIKWQRVARLSFFLLFAWASWTNWATVTQRPEAYLEYADLTWSSWYESFIKGWFASHISLMVGVIATSQAFIAISMLLKGWIYALGCLCGIIFLVSILPFGVGAGFPSTGIMAAACFILFRKQPVDFIWKKSYFSIA
jgi:hypothetical protein